MTGDGGFENRVVKQLNQQRNNKTEYKAYRRKQSRFTSQGIDLLVDSANPKYYLGIECKSMQINVEKASRESNNTEAKLYFSEHFTTDKNNVHQVTNTTEFLKQTNRTGILAIAYRRGRGRKIHEYALPWKHIIKKFDNKQSGITKEYVKQNGVQINNNYRKIFQLTN